MIKLIRQIIKNREDIVYAIHNMLFSSKADRDLAKERLKVCKQCPFYSKNTKERPYGKLPYTHCIKCGCFDKAKVYGPNSCPINYWKS